MESAPKTGTLKRSSIKGGLRHTHGGSLEIRENLLDGNFSFGDPNSFEFHGNRCENWLQPVSIDSLRGSAFVNRNICFLSAYNTSGTMRFLNNLSYRLTVEYRSASEPSLQIVGNTLGSAEIKVGDETQGLDLTFANNIVWSMSNFESAGDPAAGVSLNGFPDTAVLRNNILEDRSGY